MSQLTNADKEKYQKLLKAMHSMIRVVVPAQHNRHEKFLQAVEDIDDIIHDREEPVI